METITASQLKEMSPCNEGYRYFLSTFGESKLSCLSVIERLIKDKDSVKEKQNENSLSWANWFIVRVMTRKQYLSYAIFAAEQVIDIYEKKYPDNDKPRKAIQAAKKVLKNDTRENRAAAAAAADAAADAADAAAAYAADAAAAAAADAAAAYAADAAAAYAADAAADAAAAYAADAAAAADAADAAREKMQLTILNYGIKLLKGKQ